MVRRMCFKRSGKDGGRTTEGRQQKEGNDLLQNEISRLTKYKKSEYSQKADLTGTSISFRVPVFEQSSNNKIQFTLEHRVRNKLKKTRLSDEEEKVLPVLEKWGQNQAMSVWMSRSLPVDLNLPLKTQCPGSDTIQALVLCVGRPALVLSLYKSEDKDVAKSDPTVPKTGPHQTPQASTSTAIGQTGDSRNVDESVPTGILQSVPRSLPEFTRETAQKLTTHLLDFCHSDFILLPCVIAYDLFDVDELDKTVARQRTRSRRCYGGPMELTQSLYTNITAAAQAIVSVSFVPCYFHKATGKPDTVKKPWLLRMEDNWRDILSLLIETLEGTDFDRHLTYTKDSEFKAKFVLLEAARRLAFRESVEICTTDKSLLSMKRHLERHTGKEHNPCMKLHIGEKDPTGNSDTVYIDIPEVLTRTLESKSGVPLKFGAAATEPVPESDDVAELPKMVFQCQVFSYEFGQLEIKIIDDPQIRKAENFMFATISWNEKSSCEPRELPKSKARISTRKRKQEVIEPVPSKVQKKEVKLRKESEDTKMEFEGISISDAGSVSESVARRPEVMDYAPLVFVADLQRGEGGPSAQSHHERHVDSEKDQKNILGFWAQTGSQKEAVLAVTGLLNCNVLADIAQRLYEQSGWRLLGVDAALNLFASATSVKKIENKVLEGIMKKDLPEHLRPHISWDVNYVDGLDGPDLGSELERVVDIQTGQIFLRRKGSDIFMELWRKGVHKWFPRLECFSYFIPPLHDVRMGDYQQSNLSDKQALQRILQSVNTMERKEAMVGISQLRFGDHRHAPSYAPAAASLSPCQLDLKVEKRPPEELDVVFIHRHAGIVVSEIRTIGNISEQHVNLLTDVLRQAMKHLEKAVRVLAALVSQLCVTSPGIKKTIMLPNLKKFCLKQVLDNNPGLKQELCHCLGIEEMADPADICLLSDHIPDSETSQELMEWWDRVMCGHGQDHVMTRDIYEKLVARLCGPLMTVRDYNVVKLGEKWSETHLVLHPHQLEILNGDDPLVWLGGPPGTGKTLTLKVKAQDWSLRGWDVHVISTWYGSLAASRLIMSHLDFCSKGHVHLHKFNFKLKNDVETALKTLMEAAKCGPLCVVADEIVAGSGMFSDFCMELYDQVPTLRLWAASYYCGYRPQCLKEVVFCYPLRTPLAVTREVQASGLIKDGVVYRYITTDQLHAGPNSLQISHCEDHQEEAPLESMQCGMKVGHHLMDDLKIGAADSTLQFRDVFVLSEYSDFCENSGFVKGLKQTTVPVTILQKEVSEKAAEVALNSGPNAVVLAHVDSVRGLERKVVVWVQSEEERRCEDDSDFARLDIFSRTVKHLVIVRANTFHSDVLYSEQGFPPCRDMEGIWKASNNFSLKLRSVTQLIGQA